MPPAEESGLSDIFISYAREDHAHAEALADALEAKGWTVWWDRSIPTGESFDEVIEREITAAACVVVLWSPHSVASRWVRTEAMEGADRDVLIPILIEQVDVPLAFKRLQTTSLIGWEGEAAAAGFARLIGDIEAVAGPPRKPVERTVFFADICDSTRLTEAIGDTDARVEFAQLLAAFAKITEERGGRVVKTIGDKILGEFPNAGDALVAACEIQRHVAGLPLLQGIRRRARVGMHYGPVLMERNDLFGDVVNVAAQVVSFAAPDQALATGATLQEVDEPGVGHRTLGNHHVGAREGRLELCELLWRNEPSELTRAVTTLERMPSYELTCRMGDETVVLTKDDRTSVSIGRDPGSTLRVASDTASRNHARILSRGGLFYLEDKSTNGTYVKPAANDQVFVHRNQILLQGPGKIRLGQAIPEEGTCDIEYSTGFGDPPAATPSSE